MAPSWRYFPPLISEAWDQGGRGKGALSLGQLRQEQAPFRVCALGRDPLHPPEGVLREPEPQNLPQPQLWIALLRAIPFAEGGVPRP